MRLVSSSKVISAMGINSTDSALGNADWALDLAYPVIEGLLETSLVESTKVDYFDFNGRPFKYDSTTPVRLRLTDGFLNKDETVEVRYSEFGEPLDGLYTGTVLPATRYRVNHQAGAIELLDALFVQGTSILSVRYTSGFPMEDEINFNETYIPAWLQTAATSAAIYLLNTYATSLTVRKAQNAHLIAQQISSMVYAMLSPKFRPRGAYQLPVLSTIV